VCGAQSAAYTSARNFPLFGFMFAMYEGLYSWLIEHSKAERAPDE